MNQEKFLKITKIFALFLFTYAAVTSFKLFGFITLWLGVEQQYEILNNAILWRSAIFSICIITGVGLIKQKMWSLYVLTITGVAIIFFTIYNLFDNFFVSAYKPTVTLYYFFVSFLKIFLGIFSIYLYKNKQLFKKGKI